MAKVGRPTKYDPKYCDEIIKFFDIDAYRQEIQTYFYKNGESKETPIEIANTLPLFERFAAKIGVHRDTLQEWCKKHPEFSVAYNKAKDLQHAILVECGLKGLYNGPVAIFTMKNILGWRDKQDVTTDGKALPTPLLANVHSNDSNEQDPGADETD